MFDTFSRRDFPQQRKSRRFRHESKVSRSKNKLLLLLLFLMWGEGRGKKTRIRFFPPGVEEQKIRIPETR